MTRESPARILPGMAKTLRIIGIAWMAACAALWLYIGLFTPEPSFGRGWLNWTLPRLLADSRFGLTFLPIILAIPGALIWQRGRSTGRVPD